MYTIITRHTMYTHTWAFYLFRQLNKHSYVCLPNTRNRDETSRGDTIIIIISINIIIIIVYYYNSTINVLLFLVLLLSLLLLIFSGRNPKVSSSPRMLSVSVIQATQQHINPYVYM